MLPQVSRCPIEPHPDNMQARCQTLQKCYLGFSRGGGKDALQLFAQIVEHAVWNPFRESDTALRATAGTPLRSEALVNHKCPYLSQRSDKWAPAGQTAVDVA